jgi:hypothetical protein
MILKACDGVHLGMRSCCLADGCSLVFQESITHDFLGVTS